MSVKLPPLDSVPLRTEISIGIKDPDVTETLVAREGETIDGHSEILFRTFVRVARADSPTSRNWRIVDRL